MSIIRKHLTEILIFIFFAAVIFVFRYNTFSCRIIDWDETAYYFWAKDLFAGTLPYVNFTDDKPMGIGFIYALAMILFGKSMLSVHIFAYLGTVISAYFMYKIGSLILQNSRTAGLLTGSIFAIFSFLNDGITSNTEIFFIPYTIIAFYLLIRYFNSFPSSGSPSVNIFEMRAFSTFFLIGLLLGFGFTIKYVVAFDIISFIVIIFALQLYHNAFSPLITVKNILKLYLPMFLGGVLPLLIIIILYWTQGYMHYLIEANVFMVKFHSVLPFTFSSWFYEHYTRGDILRGIYNYLPLFLAFLLCVFWTKFSQKTRINLCVLFIWFFIVLFELLFLLTRYYNHYFIQLLPPLCLISSILIFSTLRAINVKDAVKAIIVTVVATPLAIMTYYSIKSHYIYKKSKGPRIEIVGRKLVPHYHDCVEQQTEYLKHRVSKEDYIYILHHDIVLYETLGLKLPSRFLQSFFITDEPTGKLINQEAELKSVFAKKPKYIIMPTRDSAYQVGNNPVTYALLQEELSKNYELETTMCAGGYYRRIGL